jgi:hypothetical protein
MRALVTLVTLIFCVVAFSQEARNDKPIANKDQKTKQQESSAKIDTSSLEKAIRESIKEASEKPDANANEKLEIDRQLAKYTEELAVYTKEVSKYTGDLSTFTFWLVIATAVLGLIGAAQGYFTYRSVKVSESALKELERPYVFRWHTSHNFKNLVNTQGKANRDLACNFVNRGRTPAMPIEFLMILKTVPNGQMPAAIRPTEIKGIPIPITRVIADAEERFSIDDVLTEVSLSDISSALQGTTALFLIGFMRYTDIFKGKHLLGFCGKYHPPSERFVIEGDERYNYTKDE